MKMVIRFFPLLVLLELSHQASAQGTFQGFVSDSLISSALVGANIYFESTGLGGSTDLEGRFKISNIPPGNFSVRVSYVG